MNNLLVDLHMHSTCSDGTWSPEKLFVELRRKSIDYFSVSDHDTMEAYPVPEDLRHRCIPGLEVDSEHERKTVHVLGYGVAIEDAALFRRLAQQRQNREHRALLILERLNKLGIDLTIEQVRAASAATKSVGRPHIGRALVALKYCGDLQEAFDKYLAEGREAYVPLDRLNTAEAIELIHRAGGVAALAHPRRLPAVSDVEAICRLGIDGIEVVHPSADRASQAFLFELVDKLDLFATGGSDFHGRSTDETIGIPFPGLRMDKLLGAISRTFEEITD